jgi:Protein of unknown function (DUF3450)
MTSAFFQLVNRTSSIFLFLLSFTTSLGLAQQNAKPATPSPAATLNSSVKAMDETRSLLQQWAATQRLITTEKADWETAKAMLEGRIQLLKQSIEDTEKKISESKTKLQDAKKRISEAEAEKTQIKQASEALIQVAPELEKGVKKLIPYAPLNVQEKVRVLSERIPKEGADLKNITAAERFQNILGILSELNKANLELNSLPEIHDIGNGQKAEVKVIYLGLGQGYFVNASGDIGGQGYPGDQGWRWRTDASLAPKVKELTDVIKKSVPPKLVELPAEIQ